MSTAAELPLEFRVLYQSPLVSVCDYVCRTCPGGPEAEEYSDENSIALRCSGAFCQHFGRGVTAHGRRHQGESRRQRTRRLLRRLRQEGQSRTGKVHRLSQVTFGTRFNRRFHH
jgi:hypothetical protein